METLAAGLPLVGVKPSGLLDLDLVEDLGESRRRERRRLRGLEHAGVPAREGGGELPRRHEQGEVPRDHLPADTDGLRFRAAERVLEFVTPPGVVEEVSRDERDVHIPAFLDGLAVVHRLEDRELAGPLLQSLFRLLYRKLQKDVKKSLQKALDEGAEFNLPSAIKANVITSGLKYSLATGNWGDRRTATKAGVSQVLNRLTYASSLSHLERTGCAEL